MSSASLLTATLRCECGSRLASRDGNELVCTACARRYPLSQAILHYLGADGLSVTTEVATRDRQAAGYLQHVKLPVQISNLERFMRGLPSGGTNRTVLDLGCGPGPSTGLLLQHGWSPVSIDFSLESLRINVARNSDAADRCAFVKADLRQLSFVENSVAVLVMPDFLQHLGDVECRRRFLARAFAALVPGGRFYLSFMNYNVVNRLKNDRTGTFAGGTIPYERQTWRQVMRILPSDVVVTGRWGMNTSHDVALDRMLARLPFVTHFARMILFTGHKR